MIPEWHDYEQSTPPNHPPLLVKNSQIQMLSMIRFFIRNALQFEMEQETNQFGMIKEISEMSHVGKISYLFDMLEV